MFEGRWACVCKLLGGHNWSGIQYGGVIVKCSKCHSWKFAESRIPTTFYDMCHWE